MTRRKLVPVLALAASTAALALPLLRTQAAPPVADNPPTSSLVAHETSKDPAVRTKTVQMRGFSMQLNDPKATKSYLRAIDELADMGCTWINLAIAARQQDVHSASVALELDKVPSMPDVLSIIKKAKSRGMGVMLMPMVLLKNTGSKDWRGIIDPTGGESGWDNWFATYRSFICNMADLAQRSDVDIFVVGSELLSTESFKDRWIETIKEIKNGRFEPEKGTRLTQGYKGKLTYSSNWDHYESVTFWDQLDYVGMNNYYELSKDPNASIDVLNKKWKEIQAPLLDFAKKQGKPFMFTEVGWHNRRITLEQPWNYVAFDSPQDNKPQLHAFQSFVESWQPIPKDQFMGAFIWEWCPDGHFTDPGTYSLQDTPALEVVKKWFIAP